MDTLLILYHFEAHVGAQMKQVLELQGFDCQFGGGLGVLKSVKFEVWRGQMPCEGFVGISGLEGDFLLRGHIVFTVCFLSIK